jgi:hypothetical protein
MKWLLSLALFSWIGCREVPGHRFERKWHAYRASHCHIVWDYSFPTPRIVTPEGEVYPPECRLLECHDGKQYTECRGYY